MKRFLTYAALLACSAVHAGTGSLDALRAAFVRASTASYAPDRQLAKRFIECSDSGRANDVLLLQLYMSVHLPAEEVRRLLGLIDEQGRWSDIDYADRTRGRWQPTLHLTRLYALAKLWADPGSESYRSQRLRDVLHAGIGLWLRIDPRCPNWWHNEIGVPKKLTAILLMLGDEATPEEIAGGLRILKRSQFGRTGQNKVWLAGNNLMKGLLTDDGELVQRARDAIAEEIRLTTGEGIQPDWSFHQHGPQIQFGNYGLAYAESISFWFRVLEGSPYAFPAEQYDIVRRLLTDGICRSVWQGTMDPSFCGRQVFIDAGRGKALSLAVTARNMAATGRPGSREFARIAKRNLRPGGRGQQLLLAFGLRHPPFETMVRLRADALRTYGRIRDDQPGEPVGEFLGRRCAADHAARGGIREYFRLLGLAAHPGNHGLRRRSSDQVQRRRRRKAEPLPVGRRSGRLAERQLSKSGGLFRSARSQNR